MSQATPTSRQAPARRTEDRMITASCLPDDMLLDLADGVLAPKALDAAHAHLDSCPKCRHVLVALSGVDSASKPTREVEDSRGPGLTGLPVGKGTSIGRYVVTGILGAGGMGAVYAAHDPELERKVAIKLVHQRLDGSEGLLRREARAMARLVHPNVVQVYDAGVHGTRTYVAMELVEGQTLRSWLRQTPRSSAEVVAAFLEAGRGLSAAHEAGLLHGDFKPDNVFMARDGRVKVGDFGLARPLEPAAAARASSEGASGTPAYLPPEVIAGSPPTVASDQFSFSVSLWEGLYGQRPFSGANPLMLLQDMRAGRPRSPGSARVPAWLRRAVRRGLASDPAARHPSMEALLRALAPEPRRARLPAAAALATVAALAAALAVMLDRQAGPAEARSRELAVCQAVRP